MTMIIFIIIISMLLYYSDIFYFMPIISEYFKMNLIQQLKSCLHVSYF